MACKYGAAIWLAYRPPAKVEVAEEEATKEPAVKGSSFKARFMVADPPRAIDPPPERLLPAVTVSDELARFALVRQPVQVSPRAARESEVA